MTATETTVTIWVRDARKSLTWVSLAIVSSLGVAVAAHRELVANETGSRRFTYLPTGTDPNAMDD